MPDPELLTACVSPGGDRHSCQPQRTAVIHPSVPAYYGTSVPVYHGTPIHAFHVTSVPAYIICPILRGSSFTFIATCVYIVRHSWRCQCGRQYRQYYIRTPDRPCRQLRATSTRCRSVSCPPCPHQRSRSISYYHTVCAMCDHAAHFLCRASTLRCGAGAVQCHAV